MLVSACLSVSARLNFLDFFDCLGRLSLERLCFFLEALWELGLMVMKEMVSGEWTMWPDYEKDLRGRSAATTTETAVMDPHRMNHNPMATNQWDRMDPTLMASA